MSYPDWEAVGLPPSPLLEGNERQAQSLRITFTPDRGPPMQRQGATLPNFLFGWNHYLTDSQRVIFETLYHTTIGGGSGRFTATDPFAAETCVLQFEGEYSLRKIRDDLFLLTSTVRRVS